MIAAFWVAVAVIVETYLVFPAVVAARAVLKKI